MKAYVAQAANTMKAYTESGGIADESFRLFKTIISHNEEEF